MFENGLPAEYVEQYVQQYVGYVKSRSNGRLNGGCPFCKEGNSWGKQSRFWYDPEREGVSGTCLCYNCGYCNGSANFISEVSGLTYREINTELMDYDIVPKDLAYNLKSIPIVTTPTKILPTDSINLFDKTQLDYYKDEPIVKTALEYIKLRKLEHAPSRPKSLYVSTEDFVHKNRLIIPYYYDNQVQWYQTRRLLDDDSSNYLSKGHSEKILPNMDNIDVDYPYIFMFEGYIDSMFVKNSSCVSGITKEGDFTLTDFQKNQLALFPTHEIIWVLDSPFLDETAKVKTQALLDNGERVFEWPTKFGEKYKDFNNIIVDTNLQEIPSDFILKRSITRDSKNPLKGLVINV